MIDNIKDVHKMPEDIQMEFTMYKIMLIFLLLPNVLLAGRQGMSINFHFQNLTGRAGNVYVGQQGPMLNQNQTVSWQMTTSNPSLNLGMIFKNGILYDCIDANYRQISIKPGFYSGDIINITFKSVSTISGYSIICECRGSVCQIEKGDN